MQGIAYFLRICEVSGHLNHPQGLDDPNLYRTCLPIDSVVYNLPSLGQIRGKHFFRMCF